MRNDLTWPVPDEPSFSRIYRQCGKRDRVYIPSDYVECATNNNGSAVLPYKFEIDTITKAFGTLLSYDVDSREYIVKVYNQYISTLPNELVPFAFDPAGSLICFDYKNHKEDPIVVFWEHEGAWEKGNIDGK